MASKQSHSRIAKNSLVYHKTFEFGIVESVSEDKSRLVSFGKGKGVKRLKENDLTPIQYRKEDFLYYNNVLFEVTNIFVDYDKKIKYKIIDNDSGVEKNIEIHDYDISPIPKDMKGKIRKISYFVDRYNRTVNQINRKATNHTTEFKEITFKTTNYILNRCGISVKQLENLPLYMKKIKCCSLELRNIEKSPFDFIRADMQLISYEKASKICEELGINVSFNVRCEKWSYDLMHKNNTFYIPALEFYKYFEEFCKSNSYNKKDYLDEINKFVINKTINKRNYKTTQFLLDVEKKMTDSMMELFYNKKFRFDESELLKIIAMFEQTKSPPLSLSELQKNAVINSILNKFYIINGLPGTGKSTIVECILFVFETLNKNASYSTNTELEDEDEDEEDDSSLCNDNEDDTTTSLDSEEDPIVYIKKCKYPKPKNTGLLAPTGLAYIELKNKCMKTNPPFNMDISGTCHRVMYIQFPQIMNLKKGHNDYKGKKSKNMDSLEGISPELLVIDEFSMIDSFMFKEILEWCRRFDCRLLILGDENQLPSIGPGCNLRNILECLLFSQTKLTDIKRQTGVLMNNIKKMTTEEITRDDFIDKTMCLVDIDHFIDSGENDSNEINFDNLKTLIRKERFTKDNTKFISYFKNESYLFNVINLNNNLQRIFNPEGELIVSKSKFKDKFKFKVGDIVIRTDNDYTGDDIKANGEQSIVRSYDYLADMVILEKIGEKGVEERLDIQTLYTDFNLGYALTVHKSQGSQYENVVVVIDKNNRTWDKSALYTAVSRAKEHCFVVSKEKDFITAQRSTKNLTDKISLFMKVSDTYEFP